MGKRSHASRRRYPLQVLLSVLFSALVLAAGLGVAWRGYVESRDVALAAAEENFAYVGQQTQSALRSALEPAGSMAELLALQPIASAKTLAQRLEALPILGHALSGRSPMAAAYLGYADGSFFLMRPLPDERARERFNAPADSAWLVQSIEIDASKSRLVSYVFLDSRLAELERRVGVEYSLDPRSRPWFRLAQQPGQRVLTDPYVFFTTESPGITVAGVTLSLAVGVPLDTLMARAACDAQEGPYRDFALSEPEWEAVQIASWLHDCGKVTTPEYVSEKAPEIAGAHHETMDGRGYPRGLKGSEMSPVARMMAIADIFEALTAADWPYKKAKKLSEALSIMATMKREQHIDPELFELFLRSGVHLRYAERFLRPEQIDSVDVAALLGQPSDAPAGARKS